MNPNWHDLIQRHMAGLTTDDEAAALQELLKQDDNAARLYLRYTNLDLALESKASSMDATRELLTRPIISRSPRWLSCRPLTAAVAGIVFGMFCTSVVFGYVGPRVVERVKTVFSEGFESGLTKTEPGLPREVGRWGGDEVEVVASAPGVKAHGGAKMLRFLSATYPGENSPRSQWGDVNRLVDVRDLAGEGRALARLSASFAQSSATAEESFACRVGAFALDQDLSRLPSPLELAWLQQNNSATGSRRAVLTGTGRWQEVSVEVPITSETRYVMLHLAMVQEHPPLKSGAVQFKAHFMDDVKLEIVPDR